MTPSTNTDAPRPPRPSLRNQMAWGFGSFCAALAISLCLIAGEVLRARLQQQAAQSLTLTAHNAAALLRTELEVQGRRAQVLARSQELWQSGLDSPAVRSMLERVQHISPHNVWIGVADVDGIVRNATGGLLQGQSVAQRQWFQQGLQGPFTSDLHPAKLLAGLLPSTADQEPLRLLDFSAPIYAADGQLLGVLGIHGSWSWARDAVEGLLDGPARDLQHSIFIFDAQDELIYAPSGHMRDFAQHHQNMPLPMTPGQSSRAQTVVWKDQPQAFLTAAVPLQAPQPHLRWHIVARQPLAMAYQDANRVLLWALALGALAGLLAAMIAWRIASHLSTDLKQLVQASQGIRQGHTQTPLLMENSSREVYELSFALEHMTQQLLHANEDMQQQVQQRTQELQAANVELQRQASTDPLTKLLNRRGFESRASLALALSRRSGRPLSVVSVDIDFFKRINDTHGHDVGDVVLQRLARVLTDRSRDADVVARFGGEEFVVLLPDTDAAGALHMAQTLLQHVAHTPMPDGVGHITISAGVSSLHLHEAHDDLFTMIKRSDDALYEAKRSGRNRACELL